MATAWEQNDPIVVEWGQDDPIVSPVAAQGPELAPWEQGDPVVGQEKLPTGGMLAEFGKGVVAGTLGVAKGIMGTLGTFAKAEPTMFRGFELPKGKAAEPFEEAKRRIKFVQEKFPKTHRGASAWAGRVIGEAIPYMGTALAGGYLVGPIGAAMVGFAVEGDNAYDEAITTGASEEGAQTERVIVGSINAVIEALQIGRLMRFHKTGKLSLRAFINAAKKRSYKEMVRTGKQFGSGILKLSIEEGLEEFSQEGVSIGVPAILRDVYPRKADGSPDWWAIGERLGEAALGGAVAGGILGGAGAVTLEAGPGVRPAPEAVIPVEPTAVPEVTPIEPVPAISAAEMRTVDVLKQNVEKYGKEQLQLKYKEWLKSPEGIIEKKQLGLPEGHKFEQPALWEIFNRQLITEKIKPVLPVTRKEPKKPTRKQLLKQGHALPRKLGMTETDRRRFMQTLTGMTSMKKMTPEQMQTVIAAFRDEVIAQGIEPDIIEGERYNEPIVVNGRATTMEEVVDEAVKITDDLPTRVDIPKHVHRQFFKKIRRSGLGAKLGRIFYGIDNSPLYELVNIVEQNKPGVLTEVFDDNIQQGRAISAGHKRTVSDMFTRSLEDAGITRQDLAKLSESANPRMFHGLLEAIDRGTTVHTVKINDRTYDITSAELLDVYLIAQQEDGLRHIHGGGLVINRVKTGKISAETLAKILAPVETNPQLMQLADIIARTEVEIWKPTINNVSLAIEGREIATVENWWGLEVPIPKQLAGETQKFNVNLIENKSILKDRTKATESLVVRDALQRFTGFENAIAEYVGLAQPTRIARTLINNRDFNEQLRSKGYSHLRENMHLILERAQSVFPTSGSFDKFLKTVIPGVYRAVLFFNPRVVMSQFTSVTNYQAFVSAKYAPLVTKGLSPEAVERTLEMSDIAWDRFYMGHSSLELGELAASDATLRLLTKTSSDKNKLGMTLRISDMAALATGMEIATAEYKDAQLGKITGESAVYWADKDVSFEEGSTEQKQVITKRAEWLWHRSQPSWDKWSRSVITSDPSAIKRLFFLFRSFHEKSLTILHGAHTEYVSSSKTLEDKAKFSKKYGAVLSGYTLNTILRAVIMAGLARRIKDPFDYMKDIVTAPFRMLPILGHILDGSIRSFLNALTEHRSEYRGEAIESLPLTVVNEIARAPVNFTQAVGYYLDGETEKANKSLKRAIAQLYKGIGTAMGVPVYELNRIYKGWLKPEPKKRFGE